MIHSWTNIIQYVHAIDIDSARYTKHSTNITNLLYNELFFIFWRA